MRTPWTELLRMSLIELSEMRSHLECVRVVLLAMPPTTIKTDGMSDGDKRDVENAWRNASHLVAEHMERVRELNTNVRYHLLDRDMDICDIGGRYEHGVTRAMFDIREGEQLLVNAMRSICYIDKQLAQDQKEHTRFVSDDDVKKAILYCSALIRDIESLPSSVFIRSV